MIDHPVFKKFSPVMSIASGNHLYDFIGSATNTKYKRGWDKFLPPTGKEIQGKSPGKDEHYLDWIAVLDSVSSASGSFCMAELGAGWGPWITRAALAAKQCQNIDNIRLLAVEAEPLHYKWTLEHLKDNDIDPLEHVILQGAVSHSPGIAAFPILENASQDYGAGLNSAGRYSKTYEVLTYSLEQLLAHFDGVIDFLHIDIQGAEYEAIPPFVQLLSQRVKSMMIGTHISDEKHDQLLSLLMEANWTPELALKRNRSHQLEWGEIHINDGFLWLKNHLPI